MVKKYAFIVVQNVLQSMVMLEINNVTIVIPAGNNFLHVNV